jgi:hypothetical protein
VLPAQSVVPPACVDAQRNTPPRREWRGDDQQRRTTNGITTITITVILTTITHRPLALHACCFLLTVSSDTPKIR